MSYQGRAQRFSTGRGVVAGLLLTLLNLVAARRTEAATYVFQTPIAGDSVP